MRLPNNSPNVIREAKPLSVATDAAATDAVLPQWMQCHGSNGPCTFCWDDAESQQSICITV